MLRAKAAAHPELSRAGPLAKQYTALQANTLAALWAAEQKGFNEVREVEERRVAAAKKHDMDKLVAKRLAALGIRTAPVQTRARAKLDIPSRHPPRRPSGKCSSTVACASPR